MEVSSLRTGFSYAIAVNDTIHGQHRGRGHDAKDPFFHICFGGNLQAISVSIRLDLIMFQMSCSNFN